MPNFPPKLLLFKCLLDSFLILSGIKEFSSFLHLFGGEIYVNRGDNVCKLSTLIVEIKLKHKYHTNL